MNQLQFVRTKNMSPWAGVFMLIMAGSLLAMSLSVVSLPAEDGRSWLRLGAALFCGGGIYTLWIDYRQVISVIPQQRCINIQTRTRIGYKHQTIPFSAVLAVAVDEYRDPDPDAVLTKYAYRVVAHLRDGRQLPMTDWAFERATIERQREQLTKACGLAPTASPCASSI